MLNTHVFPTMPILPMKSINISSGSSKQWLIFGTQCSWVKRQKMI